MGKNAHIDAPFAFLTHSKKRCRIVHLLAYFVLAWMLLALSAQAQMARATRNDALSGRSPTPRADRLGNADISPGLVMSIDQYVSPGNSDDDDLPAFQRAFADLGAGGGVLKIGKGPYLIDGGDLVIPPHVEVVGSECSAVGMEPHNDYSGLAGTLVVNPLHTIRGGRASRLSCFVVERKGLTRQTSVRSMLDMVASFAGTGVTASGPDFAVEHGLILGFALCLDMSGFERPIVRDVNGDCSAGLRFNQVHDIGKADHLEFFPFLTTESAFNDVRISIVGAMDNGSGLWRVELATATPLQTGDVVFIADAQTARGINGRWVVTVIDPTHLDLRGSVAGPLMAQATIVRGRTTIDGIEAGISTLLRLGMAISGKGVRDGTTIANVRGQRVTLSAPLTANGDDVPLVFRDMPFQTGTKHSGAVLYIHGNNRPGPAFEITNSEGAEIVNSFEYGYQIGAHVGEGAVWSQLDNVSFDNFFDPSDFRSVGLQIDETASGTNWSGGYVSSYGVPVYVDSRPLESNNNETAHTISSVAINAGRGNAYHMIMPLLDMQRGRLIIMGSTTNVRGGAPLQVGSPAGIGSLLLVGDDFGGAALVPFDDRAKAATKVSASNVNIAP